MTHLLGILSGILAGIAVIPYAFDTIKGRARPERASWFIWLILAVIAFSGQFAEGATNSLWLTGIDTAGVLLIFCLSIKHGTGGLTKRDGCALLAAGVGLILWYLTRHALIALGFVIAIDAIGTSLTVIKTYQDPSSETYLVWLLVSIAGVVAMFAVGNFYVGQLVYPFYIFLANFSVLIAIWAGKFRPAKAK